MEITYRKHEDFCVPNLLMHGSEPAAYGRFGRMRLKYLKEHRRGTYTTLKTSGQLTHHLNEIDREANQMLRLLIEQMAQAQGITEQLKAEDQVAWVGAVNCIRSAVEEIVGPVKIYAQNCLQTPADLKSAGNRGVVQSRLQMLHVHVLLVAPLGAHHVA